MLPHGRDSAMAIVIRAYSTRDSRKRTMTRARNHWGYVTHVASR